ncbi:hypothetical protein C5167_000471 [Papaver somniferum]|uniref:Uncharacterized protein n=1 Tax=Papaver somniferum TaxID=3469 RepID=A0A4Y7KSL4_PAPSO|nr:hypothetical protein C5167_000471 [Papaver somniferum]
MEFLNITLSFRTSNRPVRTNPVPSGHRVEIFLL